MPTFSNALAFLMETLLVEVAEIFSVSVLSVIPLDAERVRLGDTMAPVPIPDWLPASVCRLTEVCEVTAFNARLPVATICKAAAAVAVPMVTVLPLALKKTFAPGPAATFNVLTAACIGSAEEPTLDDGKTAKTLSVLPVVVPLA